MQKRLAYLHIFFFVVDAQFKSQPDWSAYNKPTVSPTEA